MNYQMIAVMLLSAVVCLGAISIFVPFLYDTIPSEEKCQSINGYGQYEKKYAERFYCEYNETGWHYNRTKFMEAWSKTENYVT